METLKKGLLIFLALFVLSGFSQCSSDTEIEEMDDTTIVSESTDKQIEMAFSHDDVCGKHYQEVYSMFENLGFVSIDYDVREMDYSETEQYDGSVIAVAIDDEDKFEKGSLFDAELPVLISYVEDLRIQVPKASVDCEGLGYADVVSLFEDAGFTNVTAYGKEIEYTTNVKDKTVLLVSIADNTVFDASAKFVKDAEVKVHYYIILPAPVQQDSASGNQNNGGGTSGSQEMVWIPQSGSKYHSRPGCSNMKNPTQVTKEEAEEMGYEPCKRCH